MLELLVIIYFVAFAMYGIDKSKAKKKRWRISEASLLSVAFLGGAYGAWLGMRVFHHKTRHKKFQILVPLAAVGWTLIIIRTLSAP
ncbi:MAG: DUF1294 domain-containing protein [Prevotellaceae bacterium]|nr:DUF1294 domain-containing protein [Prevotellaceae bacterium]